MVNLFGDYKLGYRNCRKKYLLKDIHPRKLLFQCLLGRADVLIILLTPVKSSVYKGTSHIFFSGMTGGYHELIVLQAEVGLTGSK